MDIADSPLLHDFADLVNHIRTREEIHECYIMLKKRQELMRDQTIASLHPGDKVYFIHEGQRIDGSVIDIGTKNVRLQTKGEKWRVPAEAI